MKSLPTRQSLLEAHPDSPQHALARFILNSGGPITSDSDGAIASTPQNDLLAVLGKPATETITRAIASAVDEAALLAHPDMVPTLQKLLGIEGDHADLHTLTDNVPTIARDSNATLDFLNDPPDDLADPDLVEELMDMYDRGVPISAYFHEGRPVAFCYSVGESESYWDVAIDTLPDFRRRGFATQAFLHQYEYRKTQHLQPVWGSADNNPASKAMALRLGFQKSAEIHEFALETDE